MCPPPNPLDAQVTAIKDSFNQGISENKKGSQPLFINYTIIIEYEQYVCEAAASLILSAKNIIFRTPPPDVEDPVGKEKFTPFFSHYTETLGLNIDTHLMRVILFPPSKYADLLHKVSQHDVWALRKHTIM